MLIRLLPLFTYSLTSVVQKEIITSILSSHLCLLKLLDKHTSKSLLNIYHLSNSPSSTQNSRNSLLCKDFLVTFLLKMKVIYIRAHPACWKTKQFWVKLHEADLLSSQFVHTIFLEQVTSSLFAIDLLTILFQTEWNKMIDKRWLEC